MVNEIDNNLSHQIKELDQECFRLTEQLKIQKSEFQMEKKELALQLVETQELLNDKIFQLQETKAKYEFSIKHNELDLSMRIHMEGKMNELHNLHRQGKSQLIKAFEEIAELTVDSRTNQAKLEQAKKELLIVKNDIQDKLFQIQLFKEQIPQLQGEIENQKKLNQDFEIQFKEALTENRFLKDQIEIQKQKQIKLMGKDDFYKNQINDLEIKLGLFEKENNSLKQIIEKQQKSLNENEKEITDLNMQLSSNLLSNELIDDIKQDRDQRLIDLRAEVYQLKIQNTTIQKQISQTLQINEGLTIKNTELEEHVKNSEISIRIANSAKILAEESVSDLHKLIDLQQREIEHLKSKDQYQTNQFEVSIQEKEKLLKDNQFLELRSKTLDKKNHNQNSMLSAIIKNLSQQLVEERDNFENLLKKLNDEKIKVVQITAENIHLEIQNQNYKNEVQSLNQVLNFTEEKIKIQSDSTLDSNKNVLQLQIKIEYLENNIKYQQEMYEKLENYEKQRRAEINSQNQKEIQIIQSYLNNELMKYEDLRRHAYNLCEQIEILELNQNLNSLQVAQAKKNTELSEIKVQLTLKEIYATRNQNLMLQEDLKLQQHFKLEKHQAFLDQKDALDKNIKKLLEIRAKAELADILEIKLKKLEKQKSSIDQECQTEKLSINHETEKSEHERSFQIVQELNLQQLKKKNRKKQIATLKKHLGKSGNHIIDVKQIIKDTANQLNIDYQDFSESKSKEEDNSSSNSSYQQQSKQMNSKGLLSSYRNDPLHTNQGGKKGESVNIYDNKNIQSYSYKRPSTSVQRSGVFKIKNLASNITMNQNLSDQKSEVSKLKQTYSQILNRPLTGITRQGISSQQITALLQQQRMGEYSQNISINVGNTHSQTRSMVELISNQEIKNDLLSKGKSTIFKKSSLRPKLYFFDSGLESESENVYQVSHKNNNQNNQHSRQQSYGSSLKTLIQESGEIGITDQQSMHPIVLKNDPKKIKKILLTSQNKKK